MIEDKYFYKIDQRSYQYFVKLIDNLIAFKKE